VFLVTEENHDYASVIGSSAIAYLNTLVQQYGLATQYYANTHPSIGNYFMLGTGQIITNNDSYSTIVTVDNVVRRLRAAGKTWKSYAEDIPSVGYTAATPLATPQAQHTRAALRRGERLDPAAESRPVHPVRERPGQRHAPGLLEHRCPISVTTRTIARSTQRTGGSRRTSRRYWPAPRSSRTAC